MPWEVKENLFSPQVRIIVEDVEVTDPPNATAAVREENGKTLRVLLAKQGGSGECEASSQGNPEDQRGSPGG